MSRHTPRRPAAIGFLPATLTACFALAAAAPPADAQGRQRVVVRGQPQQLSGPEGLRMLHKTGNFRDTETFAYKLLWPDIRQPEILYLLAASQERLRKPQDAAAAYTLFLRVLDEAKAAGTEVPADVAKQRPLAERRLQALRQDASSLASAYTKSKAAGKTFTTPAQVGDGWMDNVECDLFSLHGLYAWKLVGGRKDAKADWVHNTKGTLHRSGAKLVDEVEGRKGVLFTVPLKAVNSGDADDANRKQLRQLGHNSRLVARNAGGCKFLRVGVRGYGFPFELKVIIDDKELKTEKVGTDAWTDLQFDLPPPAATPAAAAPARTTGSPPPPGARKAAAAPGGQRVVLEFIVPEGQQWSEGAWLDYVDFFDN